MGTRVTRAEAAEILGYAPTSLPTMMSRYPDRWPAPVGKRRVGRGWQLEYDLDEMKAAAGTGPAGRRVGGSATVSDDDGLLTCAECGRRLRGLGVHISRVHGLDAATYRARHGLPVTAALLADASRLRMEAEGHARRDAGQLAHLEPYQDLERLRAMIPAGDPSAASRTLPRVRANRRPGQTTATRAMLAARMAKLDAAAREHGYVDAADAVEQTLHLPAKAAARATGLSAQTITRRRAEHGEP